MNTDTKALTGLSNNREKLSSTRLAFIFVTSLFFMWGLSHGLLDVLNKHFQDTLHVSRAQSGLVQTAYFGAYFIIALPVGLFMERFGYKAGILAGLALFALGALLFIPASMAGTFTPFLVALFVLACGLGCLETAANLYAAALGAPEKSEQRLTFAQSFNGLGAFIGPVIGGAVFFAPPIEFNGSRIDLVSVTYVSLAVIVMLMFVAFARIHLPEIRNEKAADVQNQNGDEVSLWRKRNFTGALLAQFCNVGAYVGIGAFFINYTIDHWHGISAQKASFLLSLGMLAYMVGRFAGTWVMRYVPARSLLILNSLVSMVLCIVAIAGFERISIFAIIAIYLFMSVMYPTIFAMGIRGLGAHTKKAGSFLVMTLVGGAFVPFMMGAFADHFGIATAFYVPLVCFAVIAWYGQSQTPVTATDKAH
ncbi:glucose/galactose MFS transporter [Pseudomonas jessenii]|uniref:MFS transporter, FHS family, L-fucose permease n=1 Tax=Pseudomonas jessenii TaxID=77298 RepID=A0A231GQ46_PSEJE|nr:sugar MFS transporter [Pseudomonas jessenii]OXR38734.1 glucose/galactose MFS transporter [Pseudomonas jessenii]SEC47466.1 MFS transporter, FHS family, L-fucose permease [Pseudomonas jessenii]